MYCEQNSFFVGQKPRFSMEFRLGNALADPTIVKFIYSKPTDEDPTVLTYGVDAAVVRLVTGKYFVELSLTEAGTWTWRTESTGIVESADQGKFRVKAESPIG